MRANSADTTRAAHSPSIFRRLSTPARVSSMRALHRGKTPNMATQFRERNCKRHRFGKVSGTKVESLTRFFGECFCESGGYEGKDFAQTIF
jgi:hypothetical protein